MANVVANTGLLIEILAKSNPRIIAIDGPDGIGKTTLANKLSRVLGYAHIKLDEYVSDEHYEYYKFIDYKKIQHDIQLIKSRKFIIEGIQLKKVLKKIKLSTDYFIYMTDRTWLYDWQETQGMYQGLSLREILLTVERYISKIQPTSPRKTNKLTSFRKELFSYTYEYRPWEKADIVFERKII